jgi:hypothetical protein
VIHDNGGSRVFANGGVIRCEAARIEKLIWRQGGVEGLLRPPLDEANMADSRLKAF